RRVGRKAVVLPRRAWRFDDPPQSVRECYAAWRDSRVGRDLLVPIEQMGSQRAYLGDSEARVAWLALEGRRPDPWPWAGKGYEGGIAPWNGERWATLRHREAHAVLPGGWPLMTVRAKLKPRPGWGWCSPNL